ncbi:hypothetical protein PIB30_072304 [Stylosanthes scabra]|uniref:Uncharacterized protein n=1 Tax=Stylosanthes scabra TaxID=79078 RepID=A0ABU6WMA5_9FABA|nr:hypothetical protein [Stylosanthes scabra]
MDRLHGTGNATVAFKDTETVNDNNTDGAEDNANNANFTLLSVVVTPTTSCTNLYVVVAPSSKLANLWSSKPLDPLRLHRWSCRRH